MAFNIYYYESHVDCKFCKKHFTTYKVRPNRYKITEEHSDFMPVYEGLNPLLYEVAVCPHCGFAYHKSMTRTYGPFMQLIEEIYIKELRKPMNICHERTIDDAITSFKLAYLVCRASMEEALLMANIALKIAWLYRLKNDTKSERRYLVAARDFYSKSFASNQEGSERILYLHAELSLRLGDISEAKKGFSRLISDQHVSVKHRKLAKNRWENYKYDEQPTSIESISQ
ncbi:DUF2225 domain-containing protein [Lysinibacillus piscis]|uniref:DUF2225 domain-containing protein n=1 Tax=Lysinibacillus piscis TaxID=2518931 RepID=A0ABQ5NNG4_9BACI|nr:DUF2225 domain-containing protein [Lysinibacillus sp. KH24]GLC89539.1 hypothetical protein LYSBPC_26660 [Lysinibacillus sp. KH24]